MTITMYRRLAIAFLAVTVFTQCGQSEKESMTQELQEFIERFESRYIPLSSKAAIAYFDASISGKEEDYEKAADLEIELTNILSNPEDFAVLKRIRDAGVVEDDQLKRQLDVLYFEYLPKQIDTEKLEAMIRLQNENEKKFSTYRSEIGGRTLTDNEVDEILRTSRDSEELKAAWTASKKIGEVVAADVLRLVRMRNEAATELGFRNYHAMQLEMSEQDPDEIEALFDELDDLTRDIFAELKAEIDTKLAGQYGIAQEELMPWHYQNRFFQEAPKIFDFDLDSFYKDKDLVAISEKFYASMELPIEDLLAASDLYEKEGKYQHAYCTDIDREGDVRVVCNIKPTYQWMNTTLHEYGHAVYDKFNDRELPWILREPAHTFTTEAIAMFFGRLAADPVWLQSAVGIPAEQVDAAAETMRNTLRLEQLVFSRWAQVMYRFEKSMYEDPEQDLNALWWQLAERYQLLRKPEGRNSPDWASKIHVALYPAYYHNYLMGELLASQLYAYIATNMPGENGTDLNDNVEAGRFLVERVFKPGRTMHWNDMIESATGEKLTASHYAKQFVQ